MYKAQENDLRICYMSKEALRTVLVYHCDFHVGRYLVYRFARK